MNNNICMNIMQHNSRRGALQGAAAPESKYRNVFAGRLLMLLMLFLLLGWSNGVMAQTKTVHWVIVALDGSRALTIKNQEATVGETAISQMPSKYKSPLLEDSDFSFYTTFAGAQQKSNSVKITTIPAALPSNDTIYVAYTYRKSYAESKGFKSHYGYNIKRVGVNVSEDNLWLVQNDYFNNFRDDKNDMPVSGEECAYFTASNKSDIQKIYTLNSNALKTGRFIWRFNIEDPYQITIQTMRDDNTHQSYYERYLTSREKWTNDKGFRDTRVVPWSTIKAENRVWCYAILPGNEDGNNNYLPSGAVKYKIIITDNMSKAANVVGRDEQGHGYLSNARNNRPDNTQFDANDNNNNKIINYSDIAIIPQSNTAFTFKVKTHVTDTWLTLPGWKEEDSFSDALTIPATLKRKYCSYEFYLGYDEETDTYSNQVTTYQQVVDAGFTPIYVKYTVDTDAMPFSVSTDYQNAVWYRLYENNTGKYIYQTGNKLQKGNDNTYTPYYFFAFIGDPYELRVINMQSGASRYLSLDWNTKNTPTSNFNNKTPEFNTKAMGYWALYDDGFTDDADHKYFALRVFDSPTDFPITSNDNQLQTSSTKTTAKFSVAAGKEFNYTFHILDQQRRIAMQYTTRMAMVTPLNYERIPAAIRSDYIQDETINFYSQVTSSGSTSADGRTIYKNPDNKYRTTGAPMPPLGIDSQGETPIDIYVTYTTNHLNEKDLHLRGVRAFSMRVRSKDNGGNVVDNYGYSDNGTALKTSATDAQDNTMYWWHVIGSNSTPDPYAVLMENVGATTNKYLGITVNTSTTPPTITQTLGTTSDMSRYFVLMSSSVANDTIAMNVMPVGGEYTYDETTEQRLRTETVWLASRKKQVKYHLIDRQGNLLLKSGFVASDEPSLPADMRSPFLDDDQYHYYDAVTITDGKYIPSGSELVSATDATGIIYVFYDECTKLTFSSGPDENRDQMYLLRYHNGVDFAQEDGKDGFDSSPSTPVYPYNNGEANLYIYSQERLDMQMGQGASTRARWAWYVESAYRDPYRVKISSHQDQTKTNGINHHSYLRSYTPRGYEYIVTGVITNNPKTTAERAADWDVATYGAAPTSYVGGSPDNVPTEYMLLGESMEQCKLVTTFLIDGTASTYGTAETDYDVANHYTVHSFEQYWKNNPTVLNLIYDFNGATTSAEKTAIQTRLNASGLTSAEKLMLRNRGWHSYNAWANINSWSSTSGKSYQYTDHWFQTVEMGETFDFVQFSIAPAVVLIDQHGWEIMRCQQGDKESLKKFNSPMVKAYHWWTESSKQPGYHKYTVSGTTVPLYKVNSSGKFDATGETYTLPATTRLEDVPYDTLTTQQGYGTSSEEYVYATGKKVKGSNDRRVDLYVTYEVKDEYRDSYVGAADEGGTSASEFLIRQGANYAVAANIDEINTSPIPGTLLSAGNVEDITDAMKWYLKPNFNIDYEMGYNYAGETGAQESAKTRKETEADNYASRDNGVTDLVNGRNGFDPYNLQVQNVQYGTYMTTSLTYTTIDTKGAYKGTYGTENTLKLTEGTETFTISGNDQVTMRITNTVFMAVQDDKGNMRLMPRFDQYNVMENFGRDSEDGTSAASVAIMTPADAQPVNDAYVSDPPHAQTTLLQIPKKYTYVVVDNQGREALRFISTDGELAPAMKPRFTSPFAKDFKFYDEATYDGENLTYTITSTDTIVSMARLVSDTPDIYVRYGYDYKADNMAVLSGGHFQMKINDTDVRLDGAIIKSYSSEVPEEYKWFSSATATINPDPYAMQIFNQDAYSTPISITVDDKSYNRFIVLPFTDSSTDEYSLVTPTAGVFDYHFVSLDVTDLAPAATITQEVNYATDTYVGTARAAKYKVEFSPYIPETITYKIITNNGHVALTGTVTKEEMDGNYLASLPTWMATPIMKSDAYHYYVAATTTTDNGVEVTTVDTDAETYSVLNLGASNIVYVRYDYNADTRQAVYTGRDGINGPYILDLSGKQPYLLSNYARYWRDTNLTENDRTIAIIDNDNEGMNINAPLSTRPLWLLKGDDPYEITLVNKHFDPENKKLYAKTPTASDMDAQNTTYCTPLKVYTDTEASAAGYTMCTFMLLPCNFYQNNNNDSHEDAGHPSLVVTGQENLVVSRPNSSSDKMYIYKRTDGQKYRATYKDKINNGHVSGHLRFEFVPMVEYHIITNEGDEALRAWSAYSRSNSGQTNGRRKVTSDNAVGLPKFAQSPLLNETDFRYFTTAPTWDAETQTLTEVSEITEEGSDEVTETNVVEAGTLFDDLLERSLYTGDIYVRYTYDRATSPLKIRTLDAYLNDDDTGEEGLDLSGETWYNLANMFNGSGIDGDTEHTQGSIMYASNGTADNQFGYTHRLGVGASGFKTLSSKNMLWRLKGDDPYAIRVYNSYKGESKMLSVLTSDKSQYWAESTASAYQTFILMNVKTTNTGYPDWLALMVSGNLSNTGIVIRTGDNNPQTSYKPTASTVTFTSVQDDMIYYNGSMSVWNSTFFRANVARLYRYHAMNCASGSPVEAWTATLEHDWLKPIVLEDAIARRYAHYEQKHIGATESVNAETWKTREELETLENAQFYANEEMDERVVYEDTNTGTTYYDYYPEIEEGEVYHIWFKYVPMTNAEIEAEYPDDPFRFSTAAQASADVATRKADGKLEEDNMQASWFFMVLDTDDTFSSEVSGTTKTFTGKQQFLRREDDGTVSWMDNNYELHAYPDDNYKNYSCHRLAESYRKGDNEIFREGRWLWAFIGDDPYNLNVLNMESAVGVTATITGVYTYDGADNCYTVISPVTDETTGDTLSYSVTIPEQEPASHHVWGICNGYGSERTMRMQSSDFLTTTDAGKINDLLYWQMGTSGVEGKNYVSKDRTQAIQLIKYVPVKYQDINLVIKRDDHVADYNAWKSGKSTDARRAKLQSYDSGISLLYFTADERAYCAGDEIDMTSMESLPLNIRRAFCDYTLYTDDYDTPGSSENPTYTVTDGPYPYKAQQATTTGTWSNSSGSWVYVPGSGDLIADEDGQPVYPYYTLDEGGNIVPAYGGAQSLYVKYKVTSDIFLKTAPDSLAVKAMYDNNDHVYFMDFPDVDSKGNDNTHHAFYDTDATFLIQTGDLSKKVDKNSGTWKTEKKKWNGSAFVDDTTQPYNDCEYRTVADRMLSVPQHLKWYFVGDPYKVQVFNTFARWNTAPLTDTNSKTWAVKTKQAQLARFSTVETNFQFVVDCVHMRMPDYTTIDNRTQLYPTDEYGKNLDPIPNRNVGKPYYNDFYWEMVPAASSEEGTFALRFKEDNDLMGYRNVYYYLAHDGLTRRYVNEGESDKVTYHINLCYRAGNETYDKGDYEGYHKANNDTTVIRLVQPVKVYLDVYKGTTQITDDELSEYYGLDEMLDGMPRHLQRKYVNYDAMQHEMTLANAYSKEVCTSGSGTIHSANAFYDKLDPLTKEVLPTYKNIVFRYDVGYTVNDVTSAGIHLFSTCAVPSAPKASELQWLDVTVGSSNWFYYDKTNTDGNGNENETDMLSNYRRAMSSSKTGWNGNANGWSDGLKGLHWAFIGDPYNFTILNRRRYEDGTNGTDPMWLTSTTTATPTDNLLMTADASSATRYSARMWKTGGDSDFVLTTVTFNSTGAIIERGVKRVVAKNAGWGEQFQLIDFDITNRRIYTSNQSDMTYNNYVNKGYCYNTELVGLGGMQQQLQIRTAVAKDNDKADNDCFDTNLRIYTSTGILRIEKTEMEIKYDEAADALPYSLRRYGCTYDCYLVTAAGDSVKVTDFDSTTSLAGTSSINGKTFREYIATKPALADYHLSYIYHVEDSVSQYFTTENDALTEDYTWMNSYFAWNQKYSGTNVEVEYYEREFDHYVYNSQGQIVDEVYRTIRKTKVVTNADTSYPTTAYLNSHTSQTTIYADEGTQSESDRQKWALVGDPYVFTMKNYAQYLENANSTLTMSGSTVSSSNLRSQAQEFAILIDKSGNSYLALIDDNSEAETSVTFDYNNNSDKHLRTQGTGANLNDPTGNTLDVSGVKPFKLTNLMRYADILQYHLVIAHQHSLDPDETYLKNLRETDSGTDTEIANRQTLRNHLVEYLKYQEIRKSLTGAAKYLDGNQYTPGAGTLWQETREDAIKTLLRENGTLRDFISFPIADHSVSRVGIGNHPQVPWYMKRQFCRYYLYQSDVLRSETDYTNPALEEADAEWIAAGKTTVSYNGIIYKVDPTAKFTYTVTIGDQEYKIVQRTFEENGVTKAAYNIKWVSVFDESSWSDWTTEDEKEAASDPDYADRKVNVGTTSDPVYKKTPKYYKQALALQGKVLDKLQDCHYNRMVKIDVVYEVVPEEFRFADRGRNTTAWYQMSTNNAADGLMNFTYKDGVGARLDRTHHYTNNYLWAPEGDPYGFVLRSRYATINGTGWDHVAVTTKEHLPKSGSDAVGTGSLLATYTSQVDFNETHIIHLNTEQGAETDGPENAVYEMFTGDAGYENSFLMHPTSAYLDNEDSDFESYYMIHDTDNNLTKLTLASGRTLQTDADANWRLSATVEQLWPYFKYSGYIGGMNPSAINNNFTYQDYSNQLETALKNGTQLDFTTLRKIQELVYAGTFKTKSGTTLAYTDPRPEDSELPLTFTPTNLVGMTDGYYRIRAFSEDALNVDGNDMSGTGIKGITGPRYISGYRFESEKVDNPSTVSVDVNGTPYTPNTLGGRWLHFLETDMSSSTIHTYADLKAKIDAVNSAVGSSDRDVFTHTAMAGNIEILPADFDPSSIFRFTQSDATYSRYNIGTQGLQLRARPGGTQVQAGVIDADCGHTMLEDSDDALKTNYQNKFRIDDIGGAAITLRTFSAEPGSGNWDTEVADNIKTNYVCIDGHHRYRITCHTNNEMVEIGDHYTTDGENGIQDTKWRLQPVGIREEWPYNEMPLRVEVNKGGVNRSGAEDTYYYGSMYVPFDTRLGNTTDAAFTLTGSVTDGTLSAPGTTTMASVSQLNNMGNPLFVPAAWPVVLRTSNGSNHVVMKNQPVGEAEATTYADRHYVNLYIPNVTPTVIPNTISGQDPAIKLSGQYLEKTLDESGLVMVFGLPFQPAGDGDVAHSNHEYDTSKQVGFFTNHNWARETYSAYRAHEGSYSGAGVSPGTVAGEGQRNNKYVYHNKIYYVYSVPGSSKSVRYSIAVFDEEEEPYEEKPIEDVTTGKRVPWPCDVYDVQGRCVARHETPQTLLKNNPSLPKGVYIFGGRKVVVK